MILVIPTSTDPELPDYTQRTILDGREYQLRFLWNQRNCAWTLTIMDQDGVVLAAGVRIVVGWPLIRRFADSRLPPGELIAVDSVDPGPPDEDGVVRNRGLDPDLEELGIGARVRLVYMDAEEMAAIDAEE